MLEGVKNVLHSAVGAVKNKFSVMQLPIMWIVASYMILLIVLIFAYFAAWVYKCRTGDIALADLLALIREVTGTSMIACITFVCGCFVDLDKDGIPDQFEKDKK